jgi:anti-sigma factor RsiW
VEHRHLLPDEIDQLLDGEAGFGVAPLMAHVESCPKCRAELAEARQLVAGLERLPHFAPSPLFTDRVMARVQVFEPWHVSALDTARKWVPASRPARAISLALVGALALVVSVGAVWMAVRLDAFLFFFDLAGQRARAALFDSLGDAIASTFGTAAVDALRSGGPVAAVGISGFLILVVLAAVGLRALVATSRRRRTT